MRNSTIFLPTVGKGFDFFREEYVRLGIGYDVVHDDPEISYNIVQCLSEGNGVLLAERFDLHGNRAGAITIVRDDVYAARVP